MSTDSVSGLSLAGVFSETMITVRWDSLPQISAYNVYVDYGKGYIRANPVPVSARCQFSFLWVKEKGIKKRVVKGNRISAYIRALEGEQCTSSVAACHESIVSDTLVTSYFKGFEKVLDATTCRRILRDSQRVDRVFPDARQTDRATFLESYESMARKVHAMYTGTIDPQDAGACVPFSTIVAKYFAANGIPVYRCQGKFINQFHSYNLVVIDGVEYVLDFTADQFLPESVPVFLPRDFCTISPNGTPANGSLEGSTQMYLVEKILQADQISFTDTEGAQKYKHLLDSLLTE